MLFYTDIAIFQQFFLDFFYSVNSSNFASFFCEVFDNFFIYNISEKKFVVVTFFTLSFKMVTSKTFISNTLIPLNLLLKFELNRVISEVTLSLPCLWASFHPLSPLSVVSAKEGKFIESQYEMLKLSI
jgi:hypothetical protein